MLSSFEMKMRDFFHENFSERVVLLLNCHKGLKVTFLCWSNQGVVLLVKRQFKKILCDNKQDQEIYLKFLDLSMKTVMLERRIG